MRTGARAVAVLLAAAATVLAGCASVPTDIVGVEGVGGATSVDEPLPSNLDLVWVTRAARHTLTARAYVTGDVTITGHGTRVPVGPVPQAMHFAGPYDFARHTGSLTVGLTGQGVGTVSEVFGPRTIFVSYLPGVATGTWAAVPRATAHSHYLYRVPGNDPALFVRLVAEAEEMARTGQEIVDGVAAVTFRGYLTTETLTAATDPAARNGVLALLRLLGPQGRRVEVWVSPAGYLVRVAFGFTARQGSDEVRELVQLDFSRFGTPVKVVKPPRNKQQPVEALSGFLFG